MSISSLVVGEVIEVGVDIPLVDIDNEDAEDVEYDFAISVALVTLPSYVTELDADQVLGYVTASS